MDENSEFPEKKKKWRFGIEMPEFSGRSWKDLNDLWPPEMRTSSEAYYILCAFLPAWDKLKFWVADLLGVEASSRVNLRFHDIGLLAWCSRCEELKEGLMTDYKRFQIGVAGSGGNAVFTIRKSVLTKYGLIENVHSGQNKFYAYRVTEKGRIVLKKFIEFVDEAHETLKVVNVMADQSKQIEKIDKWINMQTRNQE